jgi:hypothetical protein
MPGTLLIAAAGLAEAAWMMEMLVMGGTFLVIGLLALFALCWRSHKLSEASVMLLGIVTLIFQPWYCFRPFDEEYYSDTDVVQAANGFQVVGILWILTLVFVFASAVVTWLTRRRTSAHESAKSSA